MGFLNKSNTQPNSLINDERLRNILEDVPVLLRHFGSDDLRSFLNTGTLQEYPAGEVLYSEQQGEIDSGWLIVSGSIALTKHNELLEVTHPGDFLGETFLFPSGPPLTTAKVQEDAAVIQFERTRALDFFKKGPERLLMRFIRNLLESQRIKVEQLYIKQIQLTRANSGEA